MASTAVPADDNNGFTITFKVNGYDDVTAEATFNLEKSYNIKGKVTDENGDPVANATVKISLAATNENNTSGGGASGGGGGGEETVETTSFMGSIATVIAAEESATKDVNGADSATVQTDENGEFEFTGLSEGTYNLTISAEGYDDREITGIETSNEAVIDLNSDDSEYKDQLVLEAASNCVVNISVEGETAPDDLEGIKVTFTNTEDETKTFSAGTDETGKATVNVTEAGTYTVSVEVDETKFETPETKTVTIETVGTASDPVSIVLTRKASVAGESVITVKVSDADGEESVDGLKISVAKDGTALNEELTVADGAAAYTAKEAGIYKFTFEDDADEVFAVNTTGAEQAVTAEDLEAGKPFEIELKLSHKEAPAKEYTVKGKVVPGEGLEDVDLSTLVVKSTALQGEDSKTANVKADGTFEVEKKFAEGKYEIYIDDADTYFGETKEL